VNYSARGNKKYHLPYLFPMNNSLYEMTRAQRWTEARRGKGAGESRRCSFEEEDIEAERVKKKVIRRNEKWSTKI